MVNSPDNLVSRPDVGSNNTVRGPRPSMLWRAAAGLGLASFLSSVGIAGTGNAETLLHDPAKAIVSTVDDIQNATGAVIEKVTPQNNTDKVREKLKAKGEKFGEPRQSAMDKNPKTGEDGIVYEHGKLGDLDTEGVVGVNVKTQPLVIRSGEPSTDAKVVSVKELKKLGINLDDVWMTTVVGGPYDVVEGKEVEAGDWVKFTVGGKTFFAAKKFAKFDDNDKKELRIEASDGKTIVLPFNPITQSFSVPADK